MGAGALMESLDAAWWHQSWTQPLARGRLVLREGFLEEVTIESSLKRPGTVG